MNAEPLPCPGTVLHPFPLACVGRLGLPPSLCPGSRPAHFPFPEPPWGARKTRLAPGPRVCYSPLARDLRTRTPPRRSHPSGYRHENDPPHPRHRRHRLHRHGPVLLSGHLSGCRFGPEPCHSLRRFHGLRGHRHVRRLLRRKHRGGLHLDRRHRRHGHPRREPPRQLLLRRHPRQGPRHRHPRGRPRVPQPERRRQCPRLPLLRLPHLRRHARQGHSPQVERRCPAHLRGRQDPRLLQGDGRERRCRRHEPLCPRRSVRHRIH